MVRKPKGDKVMQKKMNFWIPEDLYQALNESKWILKKDVSEILREAAIEYLDNHLPKEARSKFSKTLKK